MLPLWLMAQTEQNNWYFGRYAALTFEGGIAQPRFDNPQIIYGPSASISHPVTGKLLFYTNGQTIWNGKHQPITNGIIPNTSPISQMIAVEVPGKSLLYYLFTVTSGKILQYTVIDMNQNNGDGAVTRATSDISYLNEYKFAVVKHKYAMAYWIITRDTDKDQFKAHYADSNGVQSQPVLSDIGLPSGNSYGDMVASNQGNKLAVTHFTGNDGAVEVFDFDPVCGKVSHQVILNKEPIWQNAYGAAFSPDDTKLYITFGYQLSQLIQYYGTDYLSNYFIAYSPENFNVLRLGPDGRIYMTTHDNSIPGERINAITSPNEIAGFCNYKETILRLDEGTGIRRTSLFELPKYATGRRINNPIKDSLFTMSGSCLGDTSFFSFNTTHPFDSIRWFFGDNNNSNDHRINTSFTYKKAGKYLITLNVYRCGVTYPFSDTLTIDSLPATLLPPDTTICAGAAIQLTSPPADKYLWSTGATTASISQSKTGKTWLNIAKGKCKQSDSINIANYPDPFILLADSYYLCEDDNEMTRLDAGEGFINYKWTPTNDTTQWIIVKTIGDYFVKVTDHFGCPGNDQTKVKRRCGVNVFFPNAFSPNGDGINDHYTPLGHDVESFELLVYNRWGQLIFKSNKLEDTWDGNVQGKQAPTDTYIYQATYKGYRNKKSVTINTHGQLTLLR